MGPQGIKGRFSEEMRFEPRAVARVRMKQQNSGKHSGRGERLRQHPLEEAFRGVQPFGVSGPHWKRKSCLGPHMKYIATHSHKKI